MNNTFKFKDKILGRDCSLSFLDDVIELNYPQKKYTIEYSDLDKIRCGIKSIKGYMFTIGRIFIIDFTRRDGSQFTLKFPSFYKKNLEDQRQNYQQIIALLFEKAFAQKIANYINIIQNGDTVRIENIKLNLEGIFLIENKISKWSTVLIKEYAHYFVIHEAENSNRNKSYDYLRDWNSWVIYSICQHLMHEDN